MWFVTRLGRNVGLKSAVDTKTISLKGKYWHHSNWDHTVVACLEICKSGGITKRIGFPKNLLNHLGSLGVF
jgi:hypothetical protein